MTQTEWLESSIKKYNKQLIRYANGILNDVEAAKDVVQNCYFKLVQHDQNQIKVPGWLYRDVRNRSIDIWRKRRKAEPLKPETENALSAPLPNPLEGLKAGPNMEIILQKLSKLSLRDQEVLRLKYSEGLSYQEISEVMDLTASNVGFTLFQALKTIREATHRPEEGLKKYVE